MPKRLANYFLKSVTGRLWQKKPRNFPIQMILTLLWMETCHQFVFERMDLSFPQQRGKALRSSVILKNLGANWHLKIILNVCLLEFFGAHGFHLGERLNWRVRSSNSSVHLSPSLLLGVKIAWFSTCLTHTPPLCRKREIISPLLPDLSAWKLIFSLVRTPGVSCKWSLMWTGATCAILTSIPSHRQGRPHRVAGIRICPKAEQFHDHSSRCHGGQMQRGSSNSRWSFRGFNEGEQIWIYQRYRKPPQIERMSL